MEDAGGVIVIDTPNQVQILDEVVCLSLRANTLKKGINATTLPPVMGK